MEQHFSALRALAAARPAPNLPTRGKAPEPNTYQEYVCAIDEFIALLDIPKLKTELPKLATSQQAIDSYLKFLNDLLEVWDLWKGNIHPEIANAYKKAASTNEKLPAKFDKAIGYLEILAKKVDPDTVDALLTTVDSMQTLCDEVAEKIDSLLADLLKFIQGFARQKELFGQLCALIVKDQNLKQGEIDQLQQQIDRFNSTVAADKRAIIGLSIADGVAVIFGIVAIVAGLVAGAISLVALIPLGVAIGVASAFIDKYRKEVETLNREIGSLEQEQGIIREEIKALTGYKTLFDNLTGKGATIKTYVEEVKKPWEALAADLKRIRGTIHITDPTSRFEEYLINFKEASRIWGIFMTEVEKLKLPEQRITHLPANLEIKSEADIERILRNAVSIEEYFKCGKA